MTTDYSQYYQEDDVDASIAGRNDVKGRPFWTPPADKSSRVIIMPPPANKTPNDDGKVTFYTWVPLHNYLPGSGQPVLCPRKHTNGAQRCPSCELSDEYRRNGNEKMTMKFAPTWRGLVNVLVLDGKGALTPDTRPLWWGMPKRTLEDLLNKIEERKSNGEDMRITSPRHGRHVFVRRTGSDDKTRYEIAPSEQQSPWKPEMAAFLPKMNSLEIEECYTLLPAERIAGMLKAAPANGGWGADTEAEDINPDDIFGRPEATEGVFREVVPQLAPVEDENPFGEPPEDEIEDPFASVVEDDDEAPFETGPPPAAANAPNRVAAAREKLQASIKAKTAVA